ncbi:MAG: hypothetical protein U9N34_11425, partial [Candidatus Cloacimonadota bacterium]|nr:hypothetical protein [Candidatus Cloacimonadota bacterium]
MKVKSNNLFLPRAIMLVVLLVLSFSIISAQSNDAEFVVKGLTVEDVPNDNGSGLEVSWVPLEKDKRILEYRVYRGISPDSMFFAGRIEINVKTGFAGDRVRFSDKSWTRLVDLDDIVNTPARLEQEDHQSADSPLFKSMPRDVSVLKKQMSAYTLLAGIPYKNLFLDSKPYEKNNETLAKLSLRKTKVVLKKLITGKKYYYTVVAVNEARRFFPMATPAFGVPLINSPEETNFFYGADITDTDNINFEWSRPVNTNNVIGHNIYALKKSDHESFASYKNYIAKEQKQFNNEMLASTSDEKFQKEKIEEVENPLVQIYNHPITYSETPKNFATLSKNSILEKLPQDSKLEDYDFIFSLSYQGPFETFASNPAVMKNITKSELPIVPEFNVRDQENDKGDKNLISFAKPIVFLTQSTYSNSHETKVSVNYEYAVPSEYKIDNIYFDVYSNGNKIDYVNEFFKDKSIEIDLGDNSGIKELMFKITMQTSGTELPNDYEITQTLIYDEVIQAFRAGKVIVDGEPIEDYSLSVYRKNLFDSGFRNSKDLLSTQRDHSNFIDYPKNKYKIIEGIVADKGDILVSPNINIFDNESGKAFTTSIFKKHALEDSDNSQLIKDNPFLTNLYKLKSSKKIRKKLVAAKYNNSRSYSYKILKTDGKAGFVLSEVFENEDGVKYFKPISNWF